MVRFVCISDTHSMLDAVDIPPGDVLVHAGDLSKIGEIDDLEHEYAILDRLPHEHIIVTPGNHDYGFQIEPQLAQRFAEAFPRVRTLIGEPTTVAGVNLWADPWTPWFQDWAYNFPRGEGGDAEAARHYAEIPDDTQLLITHGPPHGTLDRLPDTDHIGSIPLRDRVGTLPQLRAHVFGHIHNAHGIYRDIDRDLLYVNAAICDLRYRPTQTPIVLDWDGKRFEEIS